MKKHISIFAFIMVALSMIVFTSCNSSDDEDSLNRDLGTLTVNGTKYPVSQFVVWEGSWSNGKGKIGVVVDYYFKTDNVTEYYYLFDYTCDHQPKVGDIYSNSDLKMKPMDDSDYDIIYKNGLTYESGKMTVVAINHQENRMMVKFDNLKMKDSSYNYTFNGFAVVVFAFN